MSSTRHAVMRGPSLTGFGKRPSLMPAHQVDLLTGIGPAGARMEANRTKPVAGSSGMVDMVPPRAVAYEAVLGRAIQLVAELGFGLTEFGFSDLVRFRLRAAVPSLRRDTCEPCPRRAARPRG